MRGPPSEAPNWFRRSSDFEVGESIHTETSRKYEVRTFSALVESAGWYIEEMWTDARQSFGVFGLASLR